MQKTLRTRLGSAVLALALVLSVLPVSAMAEEGTPAAAGETVADGVAQIGEQTYATLEEAFAAVGSEAVTIRLLADTQISNTITVEAGKTITLDLNGCAVTVPAAVNNRSIYAINNYGTLTIRDTSAAQDGSISARGTQNLENGVLTLESGTINAIDSNGGGAALWNEATFYMTGGTLAFTGEKSGNSAGTPLNNQAGASATITGGSLRSPYTCVFNYGHMTIRDVSLSGETGFWQVIKSYGGSDLELRNVTVNATLGGGIEVAGGTVDIYDCTFTQQGYYDWNSVNIAVSSNGTVNVHSGTFTSENYGAYVFNSGGTINIEGGTFRADKAVLKADNSTEAEPSVIRVTGGTLTGTVEIGSEATLAVTGGTFSMDPSAYAAEGTIVRRDGSEPYTYTVLAKNNLTDGVYLSDPTGFTASNYHVTDNQDGTWTVYYSAPAGGGSSSGGNKTETTTNPDGSTTTTVTKPDGSKTETTKAPDGSSSVVSTGKDGQISATVTVSGAAVSDAKDAVTLPMPELPVTTDRDEAPVVTVKLPSNTAAKVEIPVENVTAGTVAILVKADGTEEIVKTSVPTENGVALTVESGAQVKIVDNTKDFADVRDGYWGEEAIDFAASRELFTGTSATTFSPENTMTRAMVVTVLARYEGVDTAAGDTWYAAGTDWAVEQGISDGTNLDGAVTREQLVTMLYRYAGAPAVSGTVTGFSDAAAVSSYAEDAMVWALENGILNGMSDGTLHPQGAATRAQVAAILARFVAAAN